MVQVVKLKPEETGGAGTAFPVPGALSKLASYPRRFQQFLHEVRVEMKQVNWPSREDVWSTTIVVAITVAFFGLYFLLTDTLFGDLENWALRYFKH